MQPTTVTDQYIKHLQRLNRSPKTIMNSQKALSVLNEWLVDRGVTFTDVSPSDLESFQIYLAKEYTSRGKRIGPGTLREYTGIMRMFYRWLHRERLLLSDPTANLKSPKVPKRIHRDVLSPPELKRLLGSPDIETVHSLRDAVALRLMALSGLRKGELIALDLDVLDLQEREILIRRGKGKKDRLCFIDVETRQVLARYLVQSRPALAKRNENALIVRENGVRLSPDAVDWILRRHAKQARIQKHLSPHSLRRTFCTILLKAGCNLKVIAELAGHKRLTTTARYAKVNIEELSAVYHSSHPRG